MIDFENILKNQLLNKVKLSDHNELIRELFALQNLVITKIDLLFCNHFLDEAIQLLINSIFLMEDGYFDCAFYSVRQSEEVINNMLLCASDNEQLKKWLGKEYFSPNNSVKKRLEKLNDSYSEIKSKLKEFFDDLNDLIQQSNKIIHKQGFDTFYRIRATQHNITKWGNKESELFNKLVRYSICNLYILFIVINPYSLIICDESLNRKLPFDPITNGINTDFIQSNCSTDLISQIKETTFYKSIKESLDKNEELNTPTFKVKRENYFDVQNLDKICEQENLLNDLEKVFLRILLSELKISKFYFEDYGFLPYYTSIESNYNSYSIDIEQFEQFLNNSPKFNQSYNNVYISVLTISHSTVLLEHNNKLDRTEIDTILSLIHDIEQEKLNLINLY